MIAVLRIAPLAAVVAVALSVPLTAQDVAAPAVPLTFHVEPVVPATLTKRFTPDRLGILEKLNRRDAEHLARLDDMIVPDQWVDNERAYAPLPAVWPWAESHAKAIVVSQPAQVFGAYEGGKLVRWGPVSSGRKETPTPAGVYNLTWKAKSRRSTDNQDWLLLWYFNFINSRGVSFHQFDLPGHAASHACVRLLARDAQWLYGWGEQWTLTKDQREVATVGSTVVILGAYDFTAPPPWQSLEWWKTPVVLPDDPNVPAVKR